MKTLCGLIVVVLTVLAMPASANGWRNGGGMQMQVQRHQQQDHFQRQPQRDFRNSQPPDRSGGRDGRMTEQERRDLHRDLDRANREIYKDRR